MPMIVLQGIPQTMQTPNATHQARRASEARNERNLFAVACMRLLGRVWRGAGRRTFYSEIVFYVLTVVLSYSLYHLVAHTQAGGRFADKTRQAIAFEQLRTHRTHIIVYAGGDFEIFETLSFVPMVLHLSPPVQEQLRTWLAVHLKKVQKRE